MAEARTEALAAHLAALPEPQLQRIAHAVLGNTGASRGLSERALEQHLTDARWVRLTLERLGDRAFAVLVALLRAGVPVVRGDLAALVASPDQDPIEQLEEHGLVAPVRTGKGIPTHIAITPGLESVVSECIAAPAPERAAGRGPELGAAQRRFELAIVLAQIGRHPPRLTREGRLHQTDLGSLVQRLAPLGVGGGTLERRLARLQELGAVAAHEGYLVLVPRATEDVGALHQALALSEIAAPSLAESALEVVAHLLETGAALPLRALLEQIQASLLRERADETAGKKGARKELVEAVTALFALEALVVLDPEGHPARAGSTQTLERVAAGEQLSVALDPGVAALLEGEEPPPVTYALGHVQSSFEVVADPGCDPSLLVRVGACAELVRADRAAVLRLERKSVAAGKQVGLRLDGLLADLAALSGRSVPLNVATVLNDWWTQAPDAQPVPELPPPDRARLVDAAREALRSATTPG